MKPERWKEVERIYHAAMQCQADERSAYLEQACAADPALRAEVESLLQYAQQPAKFLDTPALEVAARGLAENLRAKSGDGREQAIGGSIEQYRIVAKIGAGGMGEIYRARDPRLGRDVAIKVLPSFFSADSDRLRRFEQEARAAAALNHPNILAVFQMGTHEGAPYLVSELLEGETLREQLNRGRVSVRKAIDYAVQIARGLAAAHEKGIAHRDLKPENLFVTKDGRVKILDFGLAKLMQPGSERNSPTVREGTEAGVVMGTVGYMSPEQVRGQTADHRTDIFAFGAILYEMLTGKRAFRKPTSPETMTAILNEDPPDISQTTTSIPPALQRVVHRCLEKSPEERFQSASDLAFALEALSVNSGAAPALAWRHGRRLVRLWPVAAFVAVAAVLAYMLFPQPGAITAGHVTQITNDGRIKTAYDTAMVTDGTRLYFNEILSGKLVIGEVSTAGGGTGIVPTTLPSPQLIDISPTGSELLVASGDAFPDNPLWILSLPTGSPRRFGDISAMEASWSPDGRKIAYIQGQSELYVVDADGTGKRKLLSKSDLYTVAFSPDQRRLRLQVTDHQTHRNSFWDVNADGSNLHLVLAEDWNHAAFKCCGRWTPDGRNYVFRSAEKNGSDLWSLPECQRPLFVCRLQPVRLTNGPFWYRGRLAPGKDGGRLFAIGKLRRAELVRYDPRSRQYSPFLSGISAANVDFSLDGQWVTWVGYPDNTLWYSKADGSDARQLTYAPMEVLQGRWAHDANRIAFTAREPGQPARIYIVSREGGAIKPLLIEPHDQYDPAWGPGDSSIAFGHTAFEKSSLPIELFDLKSGKVTALPGSKDLKSPAWSPNGKYLAATSSDSRHFTILNFTTSKWTEATREFSHIENGTFSRDSKYVFFEDQRDSTIYRASVPGAKIQNVASLKDLRRPSLNSRPVWFGIGADNSFLAMRDLGLEEIYALDLQK